MKRPGGQEYSIAARQGQLAWAVFFELEPPVVGREEGG